MKKNIALLRFMIVIMSVLVLWGCPKKAEVTSAPEAQQQAVKPAESGSVASSAKVQEPVNRETAATAGGGLQPIYFDFDQSLIRGDARAVLRTNAEWLKAHPAVKIRIEGNCDERGTREYNQALGQRRVRSAKQYLVDMGVSSSRISLISYGKEKPVCTESTEDCWEKNRRGDFTIVS